MWSISSQCQCCAKYNLTDSRKIYTPSGLVQIYDTISSVIFLFSDFYFFSSVFTTSFLRRSFLYGIPSLLHLPWTFFSPVLELVRELTYPFPTILSSFTSAFFIVSVPLRFTTSPSQTPLTSPNRKCFRFLHLLIHHILLTLSLDTWPMVKKLDSEWIFGNLISLFSVSHWLY